MLSGGEGATTSSKTMTLLKSTLYLALKHTPSWHRIDYQHKYQNMKRKTNAIHVVRVFDHEYEI